MISEGVSGLVGTTRPWTTASWKSRCPGLCCLWRSEISTGQINIRKLGSKPFLFAGSCSRTALIALGMAAEEAHLAGLILLQEMKPWRL